MFEANRAGPKVLEGVNTGDGSAPESGRKEQGHGIGGAVAAIASSPVLVGCSFTNNTAVASFPSPGVGESGVGEVFIPGFLRGLTISAMRAWSIRQHGSISQP